MDNANPAGNGWQANVKRQTVRLAWWTLAWLLSMAAATFGPQFLWGDYRAVTIIGIAVNLLIGFGMIRAFRNHLRSLDELDQKIQLEAMSFTLGVALVVGLAYSNLDVSNIIAADAEISWLVILMALTYLGAIAYGKRKYR
jgi:uncharacterized protein YacL